MLCGKNNAMTTVKGISRADFERRVGTEQQCMEYLAQQKWGLGFVCKACGHDRAYKGKKHFHKRCMRCGREESATAHTLFHNVKFGLRKAFGMVYDIMLSKKGANSMWLAERYEVSQNTAWLFRRKLQQYLKSSGRHPLTGKVEVDEFEIGTPKKGKQGRASTDEKVRVVIAVEIREGTVGNAYAKVIDDFSTRSLKTIFDRHIAKDAAVRTDGWSGYAPLKRIYKRLTQEHSCNGANFPQIHIQIRNLKNWLRGVHSYCDKGNFQDYLDEYFYRFNRRGHRISIIDLLFDRLMTTRSATFNEIKAFAT